MDNAEINRLIATRVLGKEISSDETGAWYILDSSGAYPLPDYAGDIASAWDVLEYSKERYDSVEINIFDGEYDVVISEIREGVRCVFWEWDKSAPRAICLAVLESYGVSTS